jgi:diacylglycerol kinase (ATP)
LNRTQSVCLIFNPRAGRNRAARRIRAFLEAHRGHLDLFATAHPGHGRQLAKEACHLGYQLVIAAGGDGTVHEVACGILESQVTSATLGVLPIGSANDFAWSLAREPEHTEFRDADASIPQPQADHPLIQAKRRWSVDVGHVQTDTGLQEYFVESLGTGLSGRVTVASRSIRWLQGMPLYTLATLKALARFQHQPMEIEIDNEPFDESTLLFSVMLGKREGSFRLAPKAQLTDGKFDWVQGVRLTTWQALPLLPQIAVRGLTPHPQIRTGQGERIRIRTSFDLDVHTDGELLCVSKNGVRSLDIRLIPGRLRVQLISPELHSDAS